MDNDRIIPDDTFSRVHSTQELGTPVPRMTGTNGLVSDDGVGGDEMKWQEVIHGGRGGTGRGGRSGRGGDGGRSRTPHQEDRTTKKTESTTILKDVATLPPSNGQNGTNEQDGMTPMETET
eukprot:scaffold352257_cov47-Attheya_sp.AAC.1